MNYTLIEELATNRIDSIHEEINALEMEADELAWLLSGDEFDYEDCDCDCEEIEEDSWMSEEDKETITDIMKKYI